MRAPPVRLLDVERRGDMDAVITLSSGGETDDSDVEVVDHEVRLKHFDSAGLKCSSDLKDPRGTPPGLRIPQTHCSVLSKMINLTDSSNVTNGTELDTRSLPRDDNTTSKNKCFNSHKHSAGHSTAVSPVDCGSVEPNKGHKNCKRKNHTSEAKHIPILKLKRVHLHDTNALGWETSWYSVRSSTPCKQEDMSNKAPECINMRTAATSTLSRQRQENRKDFAETELQHTGELSYPQQCNTPCLDERSPVATEEHLLCEPKWDNLFSSSLVPFQTPRTSFQDEAQVSCRRELCHFNFPSPAFDSGTRQLELDQIENHQTLSPHCSPPYSLSDGAESQQSRQTLDFNPQSHKSIEPQTDSLESTAKPTPMSPNALPDNTSGRLSEEDKDELASNSPDYMCSSIPGDPPLSLCKDEDMDDGFGTGTYGCFVWEEPDDVKGMNDDCHFDVDRDTSLEDRCSVCPVTLGKIMDGSTQVLAEEDGLGASELCRQNLCLVHTTMDENYTEGTLQLLSDLLQPGYYPPKNITSHLLQGILLDPQCPQHLCVQAFNLLMRTQRHHRADKMTVPWDWELLTSIMSNQDDTKRHRHEVVCMFLEYVVQTLEDDFQAKRTHSAPHQSVAKEMLSCDLHFSRVRDVIKWMFAAIMKSTEFGESGEAARERDQHTRMVLVFQRMLSLALEVDRSPVLSSFKLSDELFHALLSKVALRAHRMLLLESLQSKLLRCKLLQRLLEYACPLKTSLTMSLSLLLHFLKNCTLTPDPTDGPDRWQRWEELVHLLWMLLLSYSKTMKGYLRGSVTEPKGRVGTLCYKPQDVLSRPAVCEAVEAFLSRSQADLGQDLPLHVHESLTYLQDYLLDNCQC
ncbi:uncharacterized protein simc1 [Genypterus blacodes]|uniref:uncharacterized protein simc1 n=1 Tax=Genypterus blacodes TaxID=154954 RepID=UPI003F76AC5F